MNYFKKNFAKLLYTSLMGLVSWNVVSQMSLMLIYQFEASEDIRNYVKKRNYQQDTIDN